MQSDLLNSYNYRIKSEYDLLKNSNTDEEIINNNLLISKIFEYYSAVKLMKEKNSNFYVYQDIPSDFKEKNNMSSNDIGIDLCNLKDTVVQCKLRKNALTWTDCATFFSLQNRFNPELNKTVIQWDNMIICRNTDSVLSNNLKFHKNRFTDYSISKNDML